MARRVLSFFILFIITFGLSVYLILNEGLDAIKLDHQHRQRLVHQSISKELITSYSLLESLIEHKSVSYTKLHNKALLWVQNNGIDADLAELETELTAMAGFPVDIYLIDEELVVRNTTFAADQDLDFKHPVFEDVRLFLAKAKSSNDVLISQPTMELTSRKFKLYSYSAMPSAGYLELGLVDPELNLFFETFIQISQLREHVSVELFFENWGRLLAPIGQAADSTGSNKQQEVDKQLLRLEHEYDLFRKVIGSDQALRVDQRSNGLDSTSYYGQLHSIDTQIGLPMRLLAKITFDNSWVMAFEDRFIQFFSVLSALAIAFMAVLLLLVKYRLVAPVQTMVKAMHDRKPIDPTPWKRLGEMAYLATNYNQLLHRNQAQLKELEELSARDPLTGLFNRRYLERIFNSEVARAARNGETLGLAMIDVDYFKAYNDLYGHPEGDKALKAVAVLLQQYFRRPNDFVFRIGGEEFAVLVTHSERKSLAAQFEAFRSGVEGASIAHTGSQVTTILTVSIGVCDLVAAERWDLADALDCADKALYRAKQTGRNRVIEVPSRAETMSVIRSN